jgi:hypothetical protein
MKEIKDFLTNMYKSSTNEITKENIKLLLENEVVTWCKCPRCGEKFEPKDGFKSGRFIYDFNSNPL